MAEAAVSLFMKYISEMKDYHASLISGAEDEVEKLVGDLHMVRDFLVNEAKKLEEGRRREIERKIKEAVYEMEVAMEACLIKAAAKKSLWSTSSVVKKLVKSLREVEMNQLLHHIQNYSPTANVSGATAADTLPSMDPTIKNNIVVCLKDEEETITGYLMEHKEKLDVISIIGVAGLGKTTLARRIYQNKRIVSEFPIHIWVHISQKFQIKDVYLTIMKWFTGQDISDFSEELLRNSVRGLLEDEKFLLVLDNVGSSEDWEAIKEALPNSNGRGKVLITSRNDHVGGKSHKLRTLRPDERWELLQLELFGNLRDWRKGFPQELARDVAQKCGGLPLQILAVAGLLKKQQTRNGWKKVYENLNTMPSDIETCISNVMELAYSMLPDELRECFLYMGVFPEEQEISVETLTCLWSAEGFIHPTEGKSLEETASQKLDDLIGRCLVMADKIDFNGEVKSCRVHDKVRAFCITKSEEMNLYQEKKESKPTGALINRLCFRSDPPRLLPENPNIRSLLCFSEQPVNLEPLNLPVDNFPKLRILESKSIKFDKFPRKLTELLHLRYLTLYIESLEILPEPLTQLWNLQSLVVETKSGSITMKANIWMMIRLRYLKTKAAIVLDNKWKGKAGENLHTLERLAPESCTEVVSKKAKNLKKLGIYGNLANIYRNGFLENLHHLEKLKLASSVTYGETSQVKLQSLPSENCFPPNLKRLTLENTFMGWQQMSILAKIKSLEALKLKGNAFVGVSWDLGGDRFPSLQLLQIVRATFGVWEASTGSFPKLRVLLVKKCEKLKEIPGSLGTCLEKLEVEYLRDSAVQSARDIGVRKKGKNAAFVLKINGLRVC